MNGEGWREGQAHIILGARSAIFMPLENLGLVILDEGRLAKAIRRKISRLITLQKSRKNAQQSAVQVLCLQVRRLSWRIMRRRRWEFISHPPAAPRGR